MDLCFISIHILVLIVLYSFHSRTYVMSCVSKCTMVVMKVSLMSNERMERHSKLSSPSKRQIDSRAIFISSGGFVYLRTSSRSFLRIAFTAIIKLGKVYKSFLGSLQVINATEKQTHETCLFNLITVCV